MSGSALTTVNTGSLDGVTGGEGSRVRRETKRGLLGIRGGGGHVYGGGNKFYHNTTTAQTPPGGSGRSKHVHKAQASNERLPDLKPYTFKFLSFYMVRTVHVGWGEHSEAIMSGKN